jgi:hypothetical protein
MNERIKSVLLLFLTCAALGFVISVFHYQEALNARPTPLPPHWKPLPTGVTPRLPAVLRQKFAATPRPVLLHFYNPDCPCSRFNLRHLRSLVWRYGKQVAFIAVLQGSDAKSLPSQFSRSGIAIETVTDSTGEIARACGVISTPQAVLLDTDRRLFYRGNYNLERYCDSPDTEFARIAIEALLSGKPCPAFPRAAAIAYGCALPANSQKELR